MAEGGTGVLSVDGKEVAKETIPHAVPAALTIDEPSISEWISAQLDDKDHQPPFRFTGKFDQLRSSWDPRDWRIPIAKKPRR